ncbi:hypothetical protein GFL38_05875 [Rhizobium leguminosarum bv. viciae]|uniref:hypothetical protein n=1 Tax=Rhizobium TaxID=379 RepID=UPI001040B66B|nr:MULTISPECIES: hypothetical protein [Rhizobium]NKJ71820.1 hypothetical protein [Rhizobium leguminosarum bv. viciae]NKK29636.1 hypothetical protein [Rhizobium leguminosarum bv. viciae]TBZ54186.1 hypothetical protein E0H42_14135 [Rhizobium leguminosarum bv. viciae]
MTHQQGSAAWILAQACFSNIYGFKAELNRERVFVFGKINDGALKPNPRSLVEFEILSGHVVGIDGRRSQLPRTLVAGASKSYGQSPTKRRHRHQTVPEAGRMCVRC